MNFDYLENALESTLEEGTFYCLFIIPQYIRLKRTVETTQTQMYYVPQCSKCGTPTHPRFAYVAV